MDTRGGLIGRHHPLKVTSWSQEPLEDQDEDHFIFHFPRLILELTLSLNHQELLVCHVRDTNGSIRRRILDPIRQDIRSIFHHLYDNDVNLGRLKELDVQIAILQALERLCEYEDSLPSEDPKHKTRYAKGWAADEISDWNDIVNNPFGLDASTVRDTASDLLGMTPEEIIKQIPDSWRVIHMESVLREDLLKRFKRYQASLRTTFTSNPSGLRNKLPPHSTTLQGRVKSVLAIDDVIDDMVKPRMTFHGTQLKSVRSIIRHGFLLPGKLLNGQRIESPRSGIAFDRGIYSSQAPSYAMSFARGQQEHTPLGILPSMRLFVCATVMGRTYTSKHGSASVHGRLVEGYDSHFDGRFEYIVHEERAMLPCYVIHLDLGSAEAQRAILSAQSNPLIFQQDLLRSRSSKDKSHPKLSSADPAPSPGDLKRSQEARKAAAMKWFPYGFGSAAGTSFVIEEIGEVSDDEEEYGAWQGDRHAYVPSGNDALDEEAGSISHLEAYESWDEDEGRMVVKMGKPGLFMDQYQGARTVEERRKLTTKRVCDDTLI
ncbi:hypothetical protein PT974_06374 [Cladobotryum mycophilum]|uniref:PARP catalytic domain-containing protein n=1 Tax=Cladobotryum mycophilum TaxID=491253 RepID=A0ABR0SLA4_9HYPO